MKKTPLKKVGRKAREWQKAKRRLLKELKQSGQYRVDGSKVYGACEDCGKLTYLTPDHIVKRSRGGGHDKENIDWVCIKCHNLRDNYNDPKGNKTMKQEKKSTTRKKPKWMTDHKCANCKRITAMYLCQHCGRASV